ncbi:MAG TPA: hypothetical protein EYP62_05320, partial [Kiritimatiellae bacterium]|nr:hypothetical protein [Kiritimatiellia bacterium]
NVLSTPNLITLDNEEAKILIGQNVPITTGSYTQQSGTASQPFQTYDRKDVGITLRVKPQITDGGLVKMQIFQESSAIVGGTQNVANFPQGPTTNVRSIETNVLANDGQVIVLGIRVRPGSPLAGRRLEELSRFGEPSEKFRLVGMVRGEEAFVPHGRTLVTTGDVVYMAVNARDVEDVLDWVQPTRRRGSRVIIVGGGAVGRRLAVLLQSEMEVVLVERDRSRADCCSAECRGVMVVHGDCLEEDTLREAAPDDQTGFAAVTGDDENNIIVCLLARRLGIGLTVARISRQHYSPVISTLGIVDRVVNDHSALLNAIMGYVRGGHVRASRSLDGFPGEILEIAIEKRSRWAGRRLESAGLPQGAIVAALQRGEDVIIPTGQTRLTPGDVMVIFSSPEAVARIRP